ncbi:MAG: ATP-dependent DNA helicase DinG [Gammaproteobacteria bacterium CG11_big_fil_rev_8_21_14_0_20_46_22]|nr:MAG: ATP-dependent DNA helicase DinG [Gammaproteobacteria bacterium CG12_big_fil_rev_8_21_14_0_65_46_12]PIR12169.1 MAG: ATP-dependent DNA helicase DinG [Gammaproteobacteria bacterium CG11_big_fil_rev_8_21_14_0_20_46_22]
MDIKALEQQIQSAGLRVRAPQFAMIECVHDTLKQQAISLIEAPTGVGKTLAYTIGALQAKKPKVKIIISTATVALQEQLIHSDIPLLETILGVKVSAGLAKGRKRYLCLSRLSQDDGEYQGFKTKLEEQYESKLWDGEKDSLKTGCTDAEWGSVSTDASGCSGSRCAFYEECVFYRQRRKVLASDVIVVNHSLLLADLGLGGGAVLPPVDECLYVIDECHHLPEKALGHFSLQSTVMRSLDWINTLSKSLTNAGLYLSETQFSPEVFNETSRNLVESLSLLRASLEMNKKQFDGDVWRLDDEAALQFADLAENVIQSGVRLADENAKLIERLDERYEHEKNLNKAKAEAIATLLSRLKFVQERAENLCKTWGAFLKPRAYKEAPQAKWIELKPARSDEPQDYTCHVAPITAGRELYEVFWSKLKHGAVLCSATVTSLGSFDEFLRRSGLKLYPNVKTLQLDSSFHYDQSILFVPAMQHEPDWKNASAHIRESADLMVQLLPDNVGSLVLFASRKAMEETLSQMPSRLVEKILVQGATGKAALIRLHKRRVDEGKTSIIFGLASFAEGLDLKGAYCEHVVIHKLPFAAPADPVEITRNEWIKFNQLDPFMLYSLPNASLRLTQYVGRLLRSEDDKGMVTILDKRLYTKAYGKKMLEALPPFKRCVNVAWSELESA